MSTIATPPNWLCVLLAALTATAACVRELDLEPGANRDDLFVNGLLVVGEPAWISTGRTDRLSDSLSRGVAFVCDPNADFVPVAGGRGPMAFDSASDNCDRVYATAAAVEASMRYHVRGVFGGRDCGAFVTTPPRVANGAVLTSSSVVDTVTRFVGADSSAAFLRVEVVVTVEHARDTPAHPYSALGSEQLDGRVRMFYVRESVPANSIGNPSTWFTDLLYRTPEGPARFDVDLLVPADLPEVAIVFVAQSLSEGYYNYLSGIVEHRISLTDPLSTIELLDSNVDCAPGFVGAASLRRDTLVIPLR